MSVLRRRSRKPAYRAVVVGCGKIGSLFTSEGGRGGVFSHAQAYEEHPRTVLVGLADKDPAMLKKATSLWKVPGGRDVVDVCGSLQPDIVSLCTPDETHALLALKILKACPPRILLIEKPLALGSKDARLILEWAKRRGTAIAVNYSRRYLPIYRRLAEEISTGVHGKPVLLRMIYGKGLFHNGSHAVDLVRFMAGEPSRGRSAPAFPGLKSDSSAMVDMRLKNGCLVRIDAFDEKVATVFEMDFLLEKSRICFRLGGAEWEFFSVRRSSKHKDYFHYFPVDRGSKDTLFARPHRGALWYMVDNLVNYLEGKEDLLCSGQEALKTLVMVEKLSAAGKVQMRSISL